MDQGRKTERLRKKVSGRLAPQTMETSPRINECTYAVLDLETTGLSNADRILEIAIVRFSGDGKRSDQWTTLVNPARDLGPIDVHEVREFREVRHAPRFEDIAADVGARLEGTVLVAHNLSFDGRFLLKEFERIGVVLPPLPKLCTLQLGCRLGAHSRGLLATCQQFGIPVRRAHRALDDAQAAACLLGLYLSFCQRSGLKVLSDLGCTTPLVPSWPAIPRPERAPTLQRGEGERRRDPYLSRLVARLPNDAGPEVVEYYGLLDRVLEDFQLTLAEAESLRAHAHASGLSERVTQLNSAYLEALVSSAWEDGVVTQEELDQLQTVATLLAFPFDQLAELLEAHRPQVQ